MSDRLPDDQVAWYAGTSRTAKWTADMSLQENIVTLAREVQDSRRLLAAIRALPDTLSPFGPPELFTAGYEDAMRQVKALLDGES